MVRIKPADLCPYFSPGVVRVPLGKKVTAGRPQQAAARSGLNRHPKKSLLAFLDVLTECGIRMSRPQPRNERMRTL